MIVGDNDLGALEIQEHLLGYEFAAGVIAVGIVWLKYAQAFADGEAGRDHQKAACEFRTARPANEINSLPSNQHRHQSRFTGAGGEFQSEACQLWVRVGVGVGKLFEETLAGLYVW